MLSFSSLRIFSEDSWKPSRLSASSSDCNFWFSSSSRWILVTSLSICSVRMLVSAFPPLWLPRRASISCERFRLSDSDPLALICRAWFSASSSSSRARSDSLSICIPFSSALYRSISFSSENTDSHLFLEPSSCSSSISLVSTRILLSSLSSSTRDL